MRTRVAILCALAVCLRAGDPPSAWEIYESGRAAEKAGRMADAFVLYSQASAMDPKNQEYWLRAQAVRSRAAVETGIAAKPDLVLGNQSEEDPPVYEPATARDLRDAREPLPPTELNALPGTKDLDIRGDSRRVFEEVARAFGLECEFDPASFQPVEFANTP